MLYGICYLFRLSQSFSIWQEYLHCKLGAIGVREESYLQRGGNDGGKQDDAEAATDGEPRMFESPRQHTVVAVLHPFGNGIPLCTYLTRLDNVYLKEGNYRHGQQERHHEIDGNGDGEVFQTVVEYALHREKEWEENSTDTDGGQHHRHEILLGRLDGSHLRFIALAEIFQIAVYHHDRVINNHS